MSWQRFERGLNIASSLAIVLAAFVLASKSLGGEVDTRGGVPERANGLELVRPLSAVETNTGRFELLVIEDPECSVCRSFDRVLTSLPDSVREHLKVRRTLFPLSYHSNARAASLAGWCADEHQSYAPFLSTIYKYQESLADAKWGEWAQESGISDTAGFVACVQSGRWNSRIDSTLALATELGVQGTPTVVLDGWLLPHPPTASLLTALVGELQKGRVPFRKRAWYRLRDSTRMG